MKIIQFLSAVISISVCATTALGDTSAFEGLYKPRGDEFASWDCESVGQDRGAFSIVSDRITMTEESCALANPTETSGDTSVSFDAYCAIEGTEYDMSITLLKTDFGVVFSGEGFSVEWERCDNTVNELPEIALVEGSNDRLAQTSGIELDWVEEVTDCYLEVDQEVRLDDKCLVSYDKNDPSPIVNFDSGGNNLSHINTSGTGPSATNGGSGYRVTEYLGELKPLESDCYANDIATVCFGDSWKIDASVDSHDGFYIIEVGRVWNDLFWYGRGNENYVSGRFEPLSRAMVRAEGGQLELVEALEFEESGGPVFEGFVGQITVDGEFNFEADVNFRVGTLRPYSLAASIDLDDGLIDGETVEIEPEGFDAAYDARVKLMKFSGTAPSDDGVSADGALTSEYDGQYTLAVGRTHNATPANANDPYSYVDKYDSLAFLRLRVEGGRFSVLRVDEGAAAPGYSDFSGVFYEGGQLEIETTVGYMYGGNDTFDFHISGEVGDELLQGNELILRPRGFNSNYAAHIVLTKVLSPEVISDVVEQPAEQAEQELLAAEQAEQEQPVETHETVNARGDSTAALAANIEAERERRLATTLENLGLSLDEVQERIRSAELVEQERLAAEEANQERLAAEAPEEAEQEQLAAEAAEQDLKVRAQAAREWLAAEQVEQERLAAEQVEQERLAAEQVEQVRLAAEEAEQERLAVEQVEKVRLAAVEAEQERLALELAEQEYL